MSLTAFQKGSEAARAQQLAVFQYLFLDYLNCAETLTPPTLPFFLKKPKDPPSPAEAQEFLFGVLEFRV